MAVPSDHDIILSLGDDLPVGIWIARVPSGEEVYANRRFADILGRGVAGDAQAGSYSAPYGICTRDGRPYPEDQLPFVRAVRAGAVVMVDDITIHRPDGTHVDVRAFANPVGDPMTHVIIAFFDITREREAEIARAESEQRLQRSQRLEAIGTLAGGIAHDFNNLIFGVKLLASELASTELDARRLESLRVIDDITERAAALTRSLLGFARRGKHRAIPVALDDVVLALTQMLRRTLVGIDIELSLQAGDGGIVIGDQSQLEQVVMNLVVNARDAVAGNGQVAVRTRALGDCVVLEVADDGPGIPVELRERVFEPYFTTKTIGPERGTGLGLATVFGIVESHRGSIELDSGLRGRGTTVRVSLPAASALGREPARAGVADPSDPADPGAAPRALANVAGAGLVLVVDDDDIVRRALAETLRGHGWDTVEASTGADAVSLLTANRDDLRAVVLDMVMPGMNGRATYLALREVDPGVRVLLMSGYSLNEEVQDILDLGVRAFLTKPYTAGALLDAVHQLTQ